MERPRGRATASQCSRAKYRPVERISWDRAFFCLSPASRGEDGIGSVADVLQTPVTDVLAVPCGQKLGAAAQHAFGSDLRHHDGVVDEAKVDEGAGVQSGPLPQIRRDDDATVLVDR